MKDGWSVVTKTWKGKTGTWRSTYAEKFYNNNKKNQKRKGRISPEVPLNFWVCFCFSWKWDVVLVTNHVFHIIFRFLDHAFLWLWDNYLEQSSNLLAYFLHIDVFFHVLCLNASYCQDLVTWYYLHLKTGMFKNSQIMNTL